MWRYVHSIIAIFKAWFSTYVIIDEIPYYNNLQNHKIHILGENITVRQFDILGNKTPPFITEYPQQGMLKIIIYGTLWISFKRYFLEYFVQDLHYWLE